MHGGPPPPPPLNRPPLPQSCTTSATLDSHRRVQPSGPYSAQQADTRTQLFVSNLPFRVRWQDLKDLMRKCGTVLRADVALNPTDGRSRGFGVVLFAKAEDAAKAIATYHGYTWQTRLLDVRIDAQDPTGALALAEANRQQAAQKAQQQGQRGSPVLPPPPPPPPPPGMMGMPGMAPMGMVPMGMAGMGMVAAPFGPMLVQVPSPLGQTFLAPAQQQQQPPSSSQQQQRSSSPYLLPEAARSSPTQLQPDQGSPNVQSRNSSASPSPSPAHSPAADSTSPTNERKSPLLAPPSRDPSSSSPVPPPPPPPGSSSIPDIPPQFQHLMAMQHAPPPPPPLSSIPPHLQQHQHPQQPHPQQAMMVPMMSIHPMGYAVPAAGLVGYYPSNDIGRPGSAPPRAGPHGSGQYTNRHLFVGNLPFNCQWQELKDLMRGAGNVLRADIAQGPDGRSRGFGSVLFASQGDAERAVGMFNGYEFNGRTLKVHFDKFAGAAVNPNQNGPNSSNGPSHHYPPPPPQHHAYPPPPPPQHPYPYANGQQHQQQQQFVMPVPTRAAAAGEGHVGAPSPLAQLAFGGGREKEGSSTESRPGTAVKREEQAEPREGGAGGGGEHVGEDEEERVKDARESTASAHHLVHPHGHPASSFSRGHHHPAAPSRIAMPPPLPFASLAGYAGATSASAATPSGPFSPLGHPTSNRLAGLGPMTPSMPAFTFGGAGPFAAQPTPPLMPGGMFSPGDFNVGPFSPGVPFFGGHQQPNGAQGAGAWGNVAPGQQTPGFNPMFPAYPYSAAHGVNGEYAQQQQEQHGEEQHQLSSEAEEAPRQQEASDEPSYFPPVSAPSPATTVTRSPLPNSASAPPLSPRISPTQGRPSLDDARTGANGPGHSVSETLALSNAFEGLAVGGRGASRSLQNSPRPQAQLDVGGGGASGSSLQPGWAEGLSPPASTEGSGEPSRRRSLVPSDGSAAGLGGAEGAVGAAQRGVSVGPTAKGVGAGLVVSDAGATGGPRRASMDSSSPALVAGSGGAPPSRGGRAAFGTSIWG